MATIVSYEILNFLPISPSCDQYAASLTIDNLILQPVVYMAVVKELMSDTSIVICLSPVVHNDIIGDFELIEYTIGYVGIFNDETQARQNTGSILPILYK